VVAGLEDEAGENLIGVNGVDHFGIDNHVAVKDRPWQRFGGHRRPVWNEATGLARKVD
jgi:hypothetical protein